MELSHVQALIDAARDGLDVGDQLLLDGLQVEPVVRRDEVDGQAQVTEPPCKRDQVPLRLHGHVRAQEGR